MLMTNKLTLPVESRMQGDLHVRFGGRLWETYHRKVVRRPSPSLRVKLPSRSVMTPFVELPFSTTDAPITGKPVASYTTPFASTLCWRALIAPLSTTIPSAFTKCGHPSQAATLKSETCLIKLLLKKNRFIKKLQLLALDLKFSYKYIQYY